MKKIKILFLLPTLTAGGAERILSFLANNIDPEKFDAYLLVTGSEKDAAYDFNEAKTIFLNKKRVLFAVPKIIYYLIKIKPQIAFSSIGHLNTVMALLSPYFTKTKFVIREASVIGVMSKFSKKKSSIYGKLARLSYPWVDAIVCQSTDMALDFKNRYKIDSNNLKIINNPITKNVSVKPEVNNFQKINLITVGRLSEEKGYERLLLCLSKISRPFNYTIIGDGPQKEEIFNIIKKLNLINKVNYIPFTKNVQKYLLESDLFLQGSFVEGFPNALLESLSVGVPAVAYNVPGGTKEIITHKVNGFLVETDDEFIAAINNYKPISPKQVRESVVKKFSRKKILNQYENLFINLINNTGTETK